MKEEDQGNGKGEAEIGAFEDRGFELWSSLYQPAPNSQKFGPAHLGGFLLAKIYSLTQPHSFKPVCDAMNSRRDALMAVALKSSLDSIMELKVEGAGAFLRTAFGERVIRYSCSVLYSFSLMV